MKHSIAYIIGDLSMGGWPTFLINLTTKLQGDFDFHFIALDNKNINPKFNKLGKAKYIGHNWDVLKKYLVDNSITIVQYGNRDIGSIIKELNIPVVIERTAGPRSCNIPRNNITHLIASNDGTVPIIRKNYSGEITVIRNGVDLDKYDAVIPDRLDFNASDFVICYCARMGGVGQGFEILINAVNKVRETHNVKLVLIGDKPAHSGEDIRKSLKHRARNMWSDCIFTGALDDPSEVMAGANLYISPAKTHGISNSIIEACALELPVIATDVGQTREIIEDKVNGILVKHGDVKTLANLIIKLKSSPKKCIIYGKNGRKIVEERFDIVKQADKYKELYMRLINNYNK